ncbi:uncharacterized protein GJ701_002187 [Geothlypis trichas]
MESPSLEVLKKRLVVLWLRVRVCGLGLQRQYQDDSREAFGLHHLLSPDRQLGTSLSFFPSPFSLPPLPPVRTSLRAGRRGKTEQAVPNRAAPSRAAPSRALVCRAVPSRAEPRRAAPSRAAPSLGVPCPAEPSRAVPCRALPCPAAPRREVPSRAEPSRAQPSPARPGPARPRHRGPHGRAAQSGPRSPVRAPRAGPASRPVLRGGGGPARCTAPLAPRGTLRAPLRLIGRDVPCPEPIGGAPRDPLRRGGGAGAGAAVRSPAAGAAPLRSASPAPRRHRERPGKAGETKNMARGGGAYAASTAGKGAPGAYNARRGAGSLPSAPFPRPCGRAGGGLGRNGTGRDGLNGTGLEVAVGSGSAVCRKFRPEWESWAGSVQAQLQDMQEYFGVNWQ